MKNSTLLSVIITAHSEGILAHRTIKSVRRAISECDIETEVILHVDNATPEMNSYIEIHRDGFLSGINIFQNTFGDLGSSRNFAIKQASGKYIATIDADDIMSKNWLRDAIALLEAQREPTIAHSEFTVEFEGTDSLIIKHGEIDYSTDTLLSVFANRWNSVIVAPRKLILENPYTPNSVGYGYEDWHFNCRMIHQHIHNILVPGTAIFVRRKRNNSEWQRQISSMAVLRANPLLAFDNIRAIANPFIEHERQLIHRANYTLLRKILNKYPKTKQLAIQVRDAIIQQRILPQRPESPVPNWLQEEWHNLHAIERQIFPLDHLMATIPVYDTITPDHMLAGGLYKRLVDSLRYNRYDYIIFVPWLIKGGADKYAISYANTIAALRKGFNVLIIGTLNVQSVWTDKLADRVDFLDFGNITDGASQFIKFRLIEHIVENADAKVLHIINSEFGYDFAQTHSTYLAGSGRKLIVTSFSQSVGSNGHLYGYSHTHVPYVYDMSSLITSDNQAVINMWADEYGFAGKKMVVHRQPIDISDSPVIQSKKDHDSFKILWAARLSPEKLPQLIEPIASQLDDRCTIDIYGTIDPQCASIIKGLPPNVHYSGAFDGSSSLPLEDYDAYLYTSQFDGMPNAILEIAEAGLPIVASAVGGIPEFIQDKETGLLIKDIYNPTAYAAALTLLQKNPNLGLKLSRKAHQKIREMFDPENYTASVESMLDTLDI